MVLFNSKNEKYGKKYKLGSYCDLNKKDDSFQNFRLGAFFLVIISMAGLVILRLYILQVFAHDYYKELAGNQHFILKNLVPKRGEIFLKDREVFYPVAVNKEVKMAYAAPREISDPGEVTRKASEVLGLDEKELQEKLSKPDDMYEPLKHRLNDEEAEKIKNLKIKGLYLADENFRYYPGGKLASQVLGFVGWKDNELKGRYGIESYFNKELEGEKGKLFQNKDSIGRWITTGVRDVAPAKNGDDLILTIDHIIQYETEKILEGAVRKFEAENGTIIVMEPGTGKIKAMANYPSFDPNNYGEVEDMKFFKNLAVSDPYECGSVFKPITLAAALDDKKINPDTTYVDSGKVVEAGYVMKNSDLKAYGLQTMSQVLERSLNTGAIYVEKLLGNENFYEYVKRFGFGEKTAVDLPAESAGDISNLKNSRINVNFFTASFGQGISVTPIQLVSAYNAIANGGTLMKPQIIEEIIHFDGKTEKIDSTEARKVISQEAANQITQILRKVVTDGHGKKADVPGYKIVGKTGTAQVASKNEKGYEEGKNIGSFVGFAPADNPRFTILIKVDNPKAVEWAESSAAPVFGELMKFLLDYENIKPTEKYTQADMNKFKKEHILKDYLAEEEEKKKKEKEKSEKEEAEFKSKEEKKP